MSEEEENMDYLISRLVAIEAIKQSTIHSEDESLAVEALEELPSAQPEHEYTMEEFVYGQDMGNPEDGSL